jgi:hypothetical protein
MNKPSLNTQALPSEEAVQSPAPILVSCVKTARETATTDCEAKQIIYQIRSGHLRQEITRIRDDYWRVMETTGNDRKAAKAAVDSRKKRLPGALLSGTFTKRKHDAIKKHSGLLCSDIDGLGREAIPEIRAELQGSPYLWALFTSPTADGLKAIFRVPADPAKHKASFRAVKNHVEHLVDLPIDEACSDVSRICFFSYDPDLYLNENAAELPALASDKDKPDVEPVGNVEIERRRKIAQEILGDIRWVSKTRGFGTCPNAEAHTTADGDRDLRVDVDGVATIYCFHDSCRDTIDALNAKLRSRIEETERAVSWEAIIADTYFIDDKYWRKSDEVWRPVIKQNFADDLRVMGINARPSSRTDPASDVLRLMSRVRAERVLDAAVPIVHDSREIIELNGRQVLNISRIRAMQPAEADDPQKSAWLHELFEKIWDPAEPQQRDYFLAWFQRFYQNALEGHPASGQAAVIAGPAGIGKTFLSWRIVGRALGGFSDGMRFLKGETSFNKEIAEVPLLAIDDGEIADDVAARNRFTNAVKKFVADPQITYHPKGVDEITIPCKNRIIITCNQDAHSLGVLPRLDTSISDKLMFFKLGDWRPRYDLPGGPEKYVARILPFWLRSVLDWKPPAYVLSDNPRFGIKPYKHPLLVGAVEEESPQTTLKQLIDFWFKETGRTAPAWMSAKELGNKLFLNDGNRNILTKELGGPRLGRTLALLGKDYVLDKRTNRSTNAGEYLITSPAICKQ